MSATRPDRGKHHHRLGCRGFMRVNAVEIPKKLFCLRLDSAVGHRALCAYIPLQITTPPDITVVELSILMTLPI